jgi:hypothetical protein
MSDGAQNVTISDIARLMELFQVSIWRTLDPFDLLSHLIGVSKSISYPERVIEVLGVQSIS